MAASLWKAWHTSSSFVVQSLVRCQVRKVRSDVFRRSVRIITPEEQEKLLLKKQGYIVDDEEDNIQSHIPSQETSRKKKIVKDRKLDLTKQAKQEIQPLKYEKLQEGDKRFGYVSTSIRQLSSFCKAISGFFSLFFFLYRKF